MRGSINYIKNNNTESTQREAEGGWPGNCNRQQKH